MVYTPRVGDLVAVRSFDAAHQVSGRPKAGQLQAAKITAVAGALATCKVMHPSGPSYASLPRWSRTAPTVMGWSRT